ncbi:DUF6879 family protein [Parafrankia sp. FMc2]|uniref:DUF6879 family protein n=1 Tax=Parafrankia sp. FMc2 TaxID=3233196 RepID=UPI0034D6EB7D
MSDEFDAVFDRFTSTAFRLETLDRYGSEEEDAELALYLAGQPLPEYSPRTDPWLKRVAATTVAGKRWQRVHVVSRPLSDYLRLELLGYEGNVAAGEDVRIADREADPAVGGLRRDFWIFDAETPRPFVMLLRYDAEGRLLSFDTTADHQVVEQCRGERDLALAWSVPLAEYAARQA